MNITDAPRLAQKNIHIGCFGGGYYVAQPYYGLAKANGPTLAPSSTTDYWRARSSCRRTRIAAVVEAVLGDTNAGTEVMAMLETNYVPDVVDWRGLARRLVKKYQEKQNERP